MVFICPFCLSIGCVGFCEDEETEDESEDESEDD